jgi:transposase
VQVSQWKKEIQTNISSVFEGKRGPKAPAAHQDPDQMLKKIGQLEMERDWLKKKLGINP